MNGHMVFSWFYLSRCDNRRQVSKRAVSFRVDHTWIRREKTFHWKVSRHITLRCTNFSISLCWLARQCDDAFATPLLRKFWWAALDALYCHIVFGVDGRKTTKYQIDIWISWKYIVLWSFIRQPQSILSIIYLTTGLVAIVRLLFFLG